MQETQDYWTGGCPGQAHSWRVPALLQAHSRQVVQPQQRLAVLSLATGPGAANLSQKRGIITGVSERLRARCGATLFLDHDLRDGSVWALRIVAYWGNHESFKHCIP
jgi:hypothetical protein